MPQEANKSLIFLQAEKDADEQPFVVVVSNRSDLNRWLRDSSPALQWIEVEGLLDDPEAWALAAQREDEVPLDVVLSEPGREFADLYRLVDVRSVRDVRVSMPAAPGFLRALRLAASLGLPVRLLPGQPSAEALEELEAALAFYLHDPMVEAPIEFFHSALAWMRGAPAGTLWSVLEEDPAIFQRDQIRGSQRLLRTNEPYLETALPRDFVPGYFAKLVQQGAECVTCPWQQPCQGYFKWPKESYSCHGIKTIFMTLQNAAAEIGRDLAECETKPA